MGMESYPTTLRAALIKRIKAFLKDHEVGRGEFGILAVNDRDFISDLEKGKDVQLSRVERAAAFMDRVQKSPRLLDRLREEVAA